LTLRLFLLRHCQLYDRFQAKAIPDTVPSPPSSLYLPRLVIVGALARYIAAIECGIRVV